MDEVEAFESGPVDTVGTSLKAAREAKGMAIEDIAAATRIPTRHLESLENSEWDKLPAPTYTMGFAKAYAGEVGLDRVEIGDRLREEMGGMRAPTVVANDYFQPTDPKRSIPIGLVVGAIIAIAVLALGLNWLLNRDINAPDNVVAENSVEAPAAAIAPPVAAAQAVVVTASEAAWVDIRDGQTILKQGELGPGQSFEVPSDAVAPTISTAKPEALRIAVGTADAPSIGPAGTKVTRVSLKAADLMRAPQAAAPAPAPTASAPPPRPARRTAARTAPSNPAPATVAAPPPAAETSPQGNATGQ